MLLPGQVGAEHDGADAGARLQLGTQRHRRQQPDRLCCQRICGVRPTIDIKMATYTCEVKDVCCQERDILRRVRHHELRVPRAGGGHGAAGGDGGGGAGLRVPDCPVDTYTSTHNS